MPTPVPARLSARGEDDDGQFPAPGWRRGGDVDAVDKAASRRSSWRS